MLGSMVIKLLEANGITAMTRRSWVRLTSSARRSCAGDVDAHDRLHRLGAVLRGPRGRPAVERPGCTATSRSGPRTPRTVSRGSPRTRQQRRVARRHQGVRREEQRSTTMEDFARLRELRWHGQAQWATSPGWTTPRDSRHTRRPTASRSRRTRRSACPTGSPPSSSRRVVKGTDGANVAEVYATDGGLAEQGSLSWRTPRTSLPVLLPYARVPKPRSRRRYPEITSDPRAGLRVPYHREAAAAQPGRHLRGQDRQGRSAEEYLKAERFHRVAWRTWRRSQRERRNARTVAAVRSRRGGGWHPDPPRHCLQPQPSRRRPADVVAPRVRRVGRRAPRALDLRGGTGCVLLGAERSRSGRVPRGGRRARSDAVAGRR